ncbi:MAG: hypothetical protein D6691_07295 [Candidatus Hydrogenedentota bacterium]|uniref:Type IV pilus biogenesis protein PilM n=1 Tax=Sumerlaea chitinivorans TaxID=2250252 RepID=A0A2Z4Y6F3_SUMC1|nr:Type IV pilus biogenesis protein PilM [Candidatus Sumerlaea chitinivorans]RMH26968.1 MAG: hypothetical protein D6691_07295 [Candidatus Hydrogenedentota bacterium]GIX45744.1 MAG: hypothetical protein KatS3mg130_2152 [Candidatus Sumerlaea sp.]
MATILAIEFAEAECKVAAAERSKNRTTLRALFCFELPKGESAEERIALRAKALKEQLAAHKIRTRRARVVIPKNYVMARMVTLPSVSEDEIAGMARFEAERHIPFNAERHVVSHHILAKLGVEGSQVLLAAVDRPIVQEYLDICVAAGLQVEMLGVSSLCMFNAFAALEGQRMGEQVAALVNIGNAYTDLVIVNHGVLSFSRGTSVSVGKLLQELSSGGQPVTVRNLTSLDVLDQELLAGSERSIGTQLADPPSDATELSPPPLPLEQKSTSPPPLRQWLLALLKEMQRTYEFARREFNCPPITHLYLAGEGALLRNIDRFFYVNFGAQTQLLRPLNAVEVPQKLREEIGARDTVFLASVGALLDDGPQAIRINLLPPDYIEKIETQRKRQSYITTGVLAAIALILAYFYVYDLFARQHELLELYRAKNKEMKSRVEDLEAKKKKLDIIRQYIQDKHGALDIIEKISSFDFIPERVTITRFEYKKDESVKIEGHAKTLPDINRFESALKATGFFESVVQDQGSNKPTRLPNRLDPVLAYSITCTFPKRTPPAAKNSKADTSEETKINREESNDSE